MKKINYNISTIIQILTSKQKGIKLSLEEYYKGTFFNLHFINLEQGLYFFELEITPTTDTIFCKEAEQSKAWTLVYHTEKKQSQSQDAGIHICFGEKTNTFLLEANQTIKLYIILIHQRFVSVYNYHTFFERIREEDKHVYFQLMPSKTLELITSISQYHGLIRIKKRVQQLLKVLQVEENKKKKFIRDNIDNYCKIALERRVSLSTLFANQLNLDNEVLEILFIDIFDIGIQKYFNDYKLKSAKEYIKKQREEINYILTQNVRHYSRIILELTLQFNLPIKTFKKIFLEEFEQRHISDNHILILQESNSEIKTESNLNYL